MYLVFEQLCFVVWHMSLPLCIVILSTLLPLRRECARTSVSMNMTAADISYVTADDLNRKDARNVSHLFRAANARVFVRVIWRVHI